eukprot:10433913-Karenia_brevis.AAC.1
MDVAHSDRDVHLHILFLDWARAFDRINPKALTLALKRFGISGQILRLIEAIYEARSFCVQGDGSESQ